MPQYCSDKDLNSTHCFCGNYSFEYSVHCSVVIALYTETCGGTPEDLTNLLRYFTILFYSFFFSDTVAPSALRSVLSLHGIQFLFNLHSK